MLHNPFSRASLSCCKNWQKSSFHGTISRFDGSKFRFEVIHESSKSKARVGRIHTPHGIIDTPNFVCVGTNGTLKGIDNVLLDSMDVQLMFVNTYHTLVHPGPEIIKKAGGIHKFIRRTQPIITDSGGFQVFSLRHNDQHPEVNPTKELKSKSKRNEFSGNLVLKISEEGVKFRSYRNGALIMLTPESSIEAQKSIGSDIIIPLDELPPYSFERRKLIKSLERTHRWEKRSLDRHLKEPNDQAIYSVIHGGVDPELRKQSIEYLCSLPFDGHAIGGSLGKDRQELIVAIKMIMEMLPRDKPNHLLGIGDLESINGTVGFGIDTFDSAYPTRNARHGNLLTNLGTLDLGKEKFKTDLTPIDMICQCHTCKHYTRAYLHHLFKMKEPTYGTLALIHNVTFMVDSMKRIRRDILNDVI